MKFYYDYAVAKLNIDKNIYLYHRLDLNIIRIKIYCIPLYNISVSQIEVVREIDPYIWDIYRSYDISN